MIKSPNRVVAIATPLIFAPLAGAVAAWTAQHAPGVDIDAGQVEAIFIAGATIAVAKAGLWMKGWQDFEKRQEAMPADALESPSEITLDDDSETDLDEDEVGIDADADLEADADIEDDDEMAEFEAMLVGDAGAEEE